METSYASAAIQFGFNQALALKHADGFAQRSAAHAQLGRELHLRQRFARRQRAVEDRFAQAGIDRPRHVPRFAAALFCSGRLNDAALFGAAWKAVGQALRSRWQCTRPPGYRKRAGSRSQWGGRAYAHCRRRRGDGHGRQSRHHRLRQHRHRPDGQGAAHVDAARMGALVGIDPTPDGLARASVWACP